MDSALKQLYQTLTADQVSPEEITTVIEAINGFVAAALYQDLIAVLSDADIKQLEEVKNEAEAKQLAGVLYANKTGETAQDLATKLTEQAAQGFLTRYNQDKPAALAQPVVK